MKKQVLLLLLSILSRLTTAAKNFTGPLKGPINDSYQCMPNKKTALYQFFWLPAICNLMEPELKKINIQNYLATYIHVYLYGSI